MQSHCAKLNHTGKYIKRGRFGDHAIEKNFTFAVAFFNCRNDDSNPIIRAPDIRGGDGNYTPPIRQNSLITRVPMRGKRQWDVPPRTVGWTAIGMFGANCVAMFLKINNTAVLGGVCVACEYDGGIDGMWM